MSDTQKPKRDTLGNVGEKVNGEQENKGTNSRVSEELTQLLGYYDVEKGTNNVSGNAHDNTNITVVGHESQDNANVQVLDEPSLLIDGGETAQHINKTMHTVEENLTGHKDNTKSKVTVIEVPFKCDFRIQVEEERMLPVVEHVKCDNGSAKLQNGGNHDNLGSG